MYCMEWHPFSEPNYTFFMEHITFVPEPLIYSSLQCRVLMNNLLSACSDNEFFFSQKVENFTHLGAMIGVSLVMGTQFNFLVLSL